MKKFNKQSMESMNYRKSKPKWGSGRLRSLALLLIVLMGLLYYLSLSLGVPISHQTEIPLQSQDLCYCGAYDRVRWILFLNLELQKLPEGKLLLRGKKKNEEVALPQRSDISTGIINFRAPCDTYHRQMKEYVLREGRVRPMPFLRGRFESCHSDPNSPYAAFSESLDIRSEKIPSCRDRSTYLGAEIEDFWTTSETEEPVNVEALVAEVESLTGKTYANCECTDESANGQRPNGFKMNRSENEKSKHLIDMEFDLIYKNAISVCGSNSQPCLRTELMKSALHLLAQSAPTNERLPPPDSFLFNVENPSTLVHPSRDAMCRPPIFEMRNNPVISLFPTEDLPNNKQASPSLLKYPSFDEMVLNSFNPLRSLALSTNVEEPQSWRAYSGGEVAVPKDVRGMQNLTVEETKRKEAIEKVLRLAPVSAFENLDTLREFVLGSQLSVIDLRWYGHRVVMGTQTDDFVSFYSSQVEEARARLRKFFTPAQIKQNITQLPFSFLIHPDKAVTLVMPHMGPGGRSLQAQKTFYRNHGSIIDPSVSRQDEYERRVGERLFAKILHKRRVASHKNPALEHRDVHSSRHYSNHGPSHMPLAVGLIASAIPIESDTYSMPTPVLAGSLLGPYGGAFDWKVQPSSLPTVPAIYDFASDYRNPSQYAILPAPMRRDEVAMQYCLSKVSAESKQQLRRSVLLSTIHGAPLVCYDSNDIVCETVKSSGAWEPHLHALLRLMVLRIRSEVRLAATILKEREIKSTHHRPATNVKHSLRYDRFAYFLKQTKTEPVHIAQESEHPTRDIHPQQRQQLVDLNDEQDANHSPTTFKDYWQRTSQSFNQLHFGSYPTAAMPETDDRRTDLEFITEDLLSTVKHLASMAVPTKIEASAGTYVEMPSIPLLLPLTNSSNALRNKYDEDILFMDIGANVGSFAFDLRVGGSISPRKIDTYFHSQEDSPGAAGSVVDGAAVPNIMLLEALPANSYLLGSSRCLNSLRELTQWRAAVNNLVSLFDQLRCFYEGAEVCSTTSSCSFSPNVDTWSQVPAQVTAPDFVANIVVNTTFRDPRADYKKHADRLLQFVSTISKCKVHATSHGDTFIAVEFSCKPAIVQPTLHNVALGDSEGVGIEDTWCVLTSDANNLADTVLTCNTTEVEQARILESTLGKQGISIGHPLAFEMIPPHQQIRGRLLPSSFIQLRTLDAVLKARSYPGAEETHASFKKLLTASDVPLSMLNSAMANRFTNSLKHVDFDQYVPTSSIRPSRGSSTRDLLLFVTVQKPFIKMDVEGFEPFVLDGAQKLLGNPVTRPLVIITEVWASQQFVKQGTRMLEEYNYVGLTIELESSVAGKHEMHLLTTSDDLRALNILLGKDMNTIVWIQRGYEDFLPQMALAKQVSLK